MIKQFWKRFKKREDYSAWRLLLLSAIIGVIAGLASVLFYILLDASHFLFMEWAAGYSSTRPAGEPSLFHLSHQRDTLKWLLVILPALGGLLSGYIVFRFAPEAKGHGTDSAIDAYHHHSGRINRRIPLIKTISSALTIGTGGSAGREGPVAHASAGLASILADYLKLDRQHRRILTAAGMAAGVGAIFHAPMAGALFAAEVLYSDMDLEYEVIIPSVISSIIAYSVFTLHFGSAPLFATPDFVFDHPAQLVPYLFLAIVVALGAFLFIRMFESVQTLFEKIKIKRLWILPGIGGLIVGIIGYFCPEALGAGYGIVQDALNMNSDGVLSNENSLAANAIPLTIKGLLFIGVAKMATTSFSIGSGGSGGVFGPAIVIGGALGGAVGLLSAKVCFALGLDLNIQPGAFAIVGMAGFFAASANTPISTIIMVSELTGNYHLLVPSMWVCILAYILLRHNGLYTSQLKNRFNAPLHRGEMLDAVLRNLRIADLLQERASKPPVCVPANARLHDLLMQFACSQQSCFPVVDENKSLLGIIRGRDLRTLITQQESMDMLIIAADLAEPVATAHRHQSLLTAVKLMHNQHLDEIVIVDSPKSNVVIAALGHQDIVWAYDKELVERLENPI